MTCQITTQLRFAVLFVVVLSVTVDQATSNATTANTPVPTSATNHTVAPTTHNNNSTSSSAPVASTQVPSDPIILTNSQILIETSTSEALRIAINFLPQLTTNANADTAELLGSAQSFDRSATSSLCDINNVTMFNLDACLTRYYTQAAAYQLCRFASYFLQAPLLLHVKDTQIPNAAQFAVDSMWDNISQVSFQASQRNATCAVSSGVSVSVVLLQSVPSSVQNGSSVLIPSSFSIFVQSVGGPPGVSFIALLRRHLSKTNLALDKAFDLSATLGFVGLTYMSPAAPTSTSIVAYIVTKDTAITTSSGVALWTFLLILVLSVSGAVVIGMTLVRWLMAQPSMPSLKQTITRSKVASKEE